MKHFAFTILIIVALTGLMLGGAKWKTSDNSEVAVDGVSALDLISQRTAAAIESVDAVLNPVVLPEQMIPELVVLDEIVEVVVPTPPPIDRPPFKLILQYDVLPDTSPVEVEPNPPNRLEVVNRWIRKDIVVFLQVEAPDLGVAEIELSCTGGDVFLWGEHTVLTELRQIALDFPFDQSKVLLLPNTPVPVDAIRRMKSDNYVYVEFRGVQHKSPIYEITLEDFTASTETLLRTCK
jgi:hypothetical protein